MEHDKTSGGFTLIELMIYIFLFSILSLVIYAVFDSSLKSYRVNSRTVDLRQNLRASLEFISDEIRMAGTSGYDFAANNLGRANAGIVSATHYAMSFSTDINMDDVLELANFSLAAGVDADNDGAVDAGTAAFVRIRDGITVDTIMDEVQALRFAYAFDENSDSQLDFVDANGDGIPSPGETIWAYDNNDDGILDTRIDGTALAGTPALDTIRVVRIWLLGRTSAPFKNYEDPRTYAMGGLVVNGNNDAFKRYLLTTTVSCRNIGL
jgi:prepilin-type N-terminal cleavage/methylation domain-containing protein